MAYEYRPLGNNMSIRLIKILPERIENQPTCTMHHFDAAAPEYEALSLVAGGDATPTRPIFLNGHRLLVEADLHDLLDRMQRNDCFRGYYWVESLSLNHNDQVEMSNEAEIRNNIRLDALRHIVWLGITDEPELRALLDANANKPALERFWNIVLDHQVPWDIDTMQGLSNQVDLKGDYLGSFWRLEEYMNSASTSDNHRQFAKIALGVFYSFGAVFETGGKFHAWWRVFWKLYKVFFHLPSSPPGLVSAVMFGLALGQESHQSGLLLPFEAWRVRTGRHDNMPYKWACECHRQTDGAPALPPVPTYTLGMKRTWEGEPWEGVCRGPTNGTACNESSIVLAVPEAETSIVLRCVDEQKVEVEMRFPRTGPGLSRFTADTPPPAQE